MMTTESITGQGLEDGLPPTSTCGSDSTQTGLTTAVHIGIRCADGVLGCHATTRHQTDHAARGCANNPDVVASEGMVSTMWTHQHSPHRTLNPGFRIGSK